MIGTASIGGIEEYLARWAEAESLVVARQLGRYFAVLVVPALGESLDLLDGYRESALHAGGRVLVILVVNATSNATVTLRENNELLLAMLATRGCPLAPGLVLVTEPEFDLLVVDRASRGRELPNKLGVGLARKIGADIALALFAQRRVERPILYFTDADAELPSDYFQRGSYLLNNRAGAWLFPFCHVAGDDCDTFKATQLYELSIRYHVLGLAYAGSPYAYHSVGSTLAIPVNSYAAVRGVPKRNAAEDFYLLDKLGKISPLRRLAGTPIRLRSRKSWRVPFGTGPRVATIMDEGDVLVANPIAYDVLRLVMAALNDFARGSDEGVFYRMFDALPATIATAAQGVFVDCGLPKAVVDAANRTSQSNLRRRIHCWFDALRTLQFMHALRRAGILDVSWRVAIRSAPFVNLPDQLDAATAVARLLEFESELPTEAGASVIRPKPRLRKG